MAAFTRGLGGEIVDGFELGICVLKSMVSLGLRGHHPHPPTPSPASGRGGEAHPCMRAICAIFTW